MTVYSAWQEGRRLAAQKAEKRPIRTPILTRLYHVLIMVMSQLPIWKRAKTIVMQWAGLGSITYAAFQWDSIAGFVVAGVSLLILDQFGGD